MNQGLPKLVVERLRAAQPDAHPDADLLTAFAEKSLPARERDSVLQHLAACGDCREVVALTAPEQAVVPASLPASRSWLAWPYLRWGAALACVVVVGAAVTLRQERHATQPAEKDEEIAATQPASSQRDEAAPVAQKQQVADRLEKSEKDAKGKVENRKAPAVAAPAPATRQLTLQARNYDSLQSLADDKTRADSPPARAKEQNEVVVNGAAAPAENKADNQKDADQREYLKMPPAAVPPAAMSETVEVTAAAPAVQTDSASVQKAQTTGALVARKAAKAPGGAAGKMNQMSDARAASQLTSLDASLAARWTLSPEGVLQRSLDSGTTWTPINVSPNLVLRAVSASGFEVWVGGASGALFHSLDNGAHWTQVQPSVNGNTLTSDIIGLEFKDLAHGQLTTADEMWTTSDGGKTWSRTQK